MYRAESRRVWCDRQPNLFSLETQAKLHIKAGLRLSLVIQGLGFCSLLIGGVSPSLGIHDATGIRLCEVNTGPREGRGQLFSLLLRGGWFVGTGATVATTEWLPGHLLERGSKEVRVAP